MATETVSVLDTIQPRWAVPPMKAVLPQEVAACYSHRIEKPEGSLDAARVLAVTDKGLVVVDVVVIQVGYQGFPQQTAHVRRIPLRRVASLTHVVGLQEGGTRESREAVSASLEIHLEGPAEVIRLPYADSDHGGEHHIERINAINGVAAALITVL